MKLTKNKISKLYSKNNQTFKRYNPRLEKSQNKSFRKLTHLDLKNRTLKNLIGGQELKKDDTHSENEAKLAEAKDGKTHGSTESPSLPVSSIETPATISTEKPLVPTSSLPVSSTENTLVEPLSTISSETISQAKEGEGEEKQAEGQQLEEKQAEEGKEKEQAEVEEKQLEVEEKQLEGEEKRAEEGKEKEQAEGQQVEGQQVEEKQAEGEEKQAEGEEKQAEEKEQAQGRQAEGEEKEKQAEGEEKEQQAEEKEQTEGRQAKVEVEGEEAEGEVEGQQAEGEAEGQQAEGEEKEQADIASSEPDVPSRLNGEPLPEDVSIATKTLIDYVTKQINSGSAVNNGIQNTMSAFQNMTNTFAQTKGGRSKKLQRKIRNKKTKKH